MDTSPVSTIESLIKNYIEQKEKSFRFGRKKLDAEKEYNKLLTKYNGEAKNYTLEQADTIYRAWCEMNTSHEEATNAQQKFSDAEEKLNEIGRILFEATINAEITFSAAEGGTPVRKQVTVSYNNGQAIVN